MTKREREKMRQNEAEENGQDGAHLVFRDLDAPHFTLVQELFLERPDERVLLHHRYGDLSAEQRIDEGG